MIASKKIWIIVGGLVLLLAVGAGVWKSRGSAPAEPQPAFTKPEDVVPAPDKTADHQLRGVLRDSDNVELGNLMLASDDNKTIYLNTTRDFETLVGKPVVVTIDGTTTDFRLINIQAQ